jgi:SAM-dependent methyltransferase
MNFYINTLLKFPFFYRFYQSIIRKKFDDYSFFEFILRDLYKKNKKIKVLDLCCGDSFVINYINPYIYKYLGLDNNKLYLESGKKKWNKYSFKFFDFSKLDNLKKKINFYPDLIFLNGVIHHFDDHQIKAINNFVMKNFPQSVFLSIDPIRYKNNFFNSLLIRLDRGNFIRSLKMYRIIMKNYKFLISDFFFIINYKVIFHYKNINLKFLYNSWKKKLI